jgi:ATP-dependent helicase/nuclease subunit B
MLAHPQYHLKLLLNRMGVNRSEVDPWHRAGLAAAPPERSKAISNLFLPPEGSAAWVFLKPEQRRLSGVRLIESAHPGEEAQSVALLIREALEVPEKRIALITPDRMLAARVVAHLKRWDVVADDSAGRALSQTAAGRVLLLLAEVAADQAAPVPLLALLTHPLVGAGEGRAAWLDNARALDLALRGPRPAPGLTPLRQIVADLHRRGRGANIQEWWSQFEATLSPLLGDAESIGLGEVLGLLADAGEALCGERLWAETDGRALSAWTEELRAAANASGTALSARDLPAVLRDAMDRVSVRPTWGGHPRVAIYGLLEARMSRAELVICAGLTEGTWPASPSPEPSLPPPVLRALGVPGGEFRIGLAAHDLAGALGAPEVVLSWAQRDVGGPVIPSRFVLRVQAMLGELAESHRERTAPMLARAIDDAPLAPPYPQPKPQPSAAQRDVPLAVTAIDRLRGDPYQFYAGAILRLRALDPLDADPSAAWKGTVVHNVMDRWHKAGGRAGELLALAAEELAAMQAHPLVRGLWWPRLSKGLEWVDAQITRDSGEGRAVLDSEISGAISLGGVRIHGRADRIDRKADGHLVVVDYKTGAPPNGSQVQQGFALQLGTLALIAAKGGFDGVAGVPDGFEYWSLGKSKEGESAFGYRFEPVLEGRKKTGLPRGQFLERTEFYLLDAVTKWIRGDVPFTARLNPDLGGYNAYDQLMRLDEWQARGEAEA